MCSVIDFNKIEKYVKDLMSKIVKENGHYHNLNHTLEVLDVSYQISLAENITLDEIEIIKIAAWFHDTGYVVGCEGHEKQSALYAKDYLLNESYPEDRIELVAGCINATRIPQSPKNKIEEILCDADLHHLGLPSSDARAELLRQEIELLKNITFTDKEWFSLSVNFLKQHKYFTNYAKERYGYQKEINLRDLENRLMKLVES